MEPYKNNNKTQLFIIALSVIYLLTVFCITLAFFYFSTQEGATIILGIVAVLLALIYLSLLALQFVRIKAHTEASHEMIQLEAQKITEKDWKLRQTLKKLEKEKDKAVILEKLKSDFVTIMAHKFRTPLSEIKWALDSLDSAELPGADQKSLLKKTAAANELLIDLVDELLNVTLLEEGAFSYHFSPYSLTNLTQEIIQGLEHAIKSKKINLVFTAEPRSDFSLKMDKDKLMIAIGNIIDNAIKYSDAGKEVSIELKRETNNFLLSVSDFGAGIPANEQGRVFTKFFRGEKAIPMDTEGFGLGLYFSQKIVEAHQGTITFKTQPGEKTTFYISLPINP